MNDILTARLKECTTRIGSMCGDGRPPRMSVPVRDDDDDIFITTTCLQAAKEIDRLRDSTEQCRVYRDALEKTGRDIGNLLALIHRDGGHYEAVHGRDMALDEAVRIVGDFNSAVDQFNADALRYRWLRDKARSVDWSYFVDVEATPPCIAYCSQSRSARESMDAAIDLAMEGTS